MIWWICLWLAGIATAWLIGVILASREMRWRIRVALKVLRGRGVVCKIGIHVPQIEGLHLRADHADFSHITWLFDGPPPLSRDEPSGIWLNDRQLSMAEALGRP